MAKRSRQQQLVAEGSSRRRCCNSFSLKATACRRSLLSHSSGPSSFRSSSDDWVQSGALHLRASSVHHTRVRKTEYARPPSRRARLWRPGASPFTRKLYLRGCFKDAPPPVFTTEPERGRRGLPPACTRGRRRGDAEAKPEAAPLGGYAVRGLYGDRRSLAVERRPVSDLGFAYVSAPRSARLAHDDQIRSDEL